MQMISYGRSTDARHYGKSQRPIEERLPYFFPKPSHSKSFKRLSQVRLYFELYYNETISDDPFYCGHYTYYMFYIYVCHDNHIYLRIRGPCFKKIFDTFEYIYLGIHTGVYIINCTPI